MAGKKFDITDPKVSLFMIEMYEKEFLIRDRWNRKNKEMIEHAAVLKREPKNYDDSAIKAYCMIQGMAATTRDYIASGCNRYTNPAADLDIAKGIETIRHGHSIVDVGLGDPKKDPKLIRPDTDLSLDPIMRPVEPSLKNLLYELTPHRAIYINERNKIKPEDKYYFPVCSNWDYGWRIGYSGMVHPPRRGRHGSLRAVLKSRVGPQPDPAHYNVNLGTSCKYF